MHAVGIADPERTMSVLAVEDEELAGRSAARLLITASAHGGAEALARRIHGAGPRAGSPFVRMQARDFPIESRMLRDNCSKLLDAAAGGSVFIADVEEMPPSVQDLLVDVLAEIEFARAPSTDVRLIVGTTVSLLDRVAAGAFSDRLFYRLNAIHLIVLNGGS
jgi:DNA-binding NtrC family response regulator